MIQTYSQKYLIKRPTLKAGDIVRVHQEILEGSKKRIQVFEGMVIRVSHGTGLNATFTVRRVSLGVGVEKIFPFHLPTIKKIEIKKSSKVRRARLYYLRDLTGKKARLKDKKLSKDVLEMMTAIEDETSTKENSNSQETNSKQIPNPKSQIKKEKAKEQEEVKK